MISVLFLTGDARLEFLRNVDSRQARNAGEQQLRASRVTPRQEQRSSKLKFGSRFVQQRAPPEILFALNEGWTKSNLSRCYAYRTRALDGYHLVKVQHARCAREPCTMATCPCTMATCPAARPCRNGHLSSHYYLDDLTLYRII